MNVCSIERMDYFLFCVVMRYPFWEGTWWSSFGTLFAGDFFPEIKVQKIYSFEFLSRLYSEIVPVILRYNSRSDIAPELIAKSLSFVKFCSYHIRSLFIWMFLSQDYTFSKQLLGKVILRNSGKKVLSASFFHSFVQLDYDHVHSPEP